MTNYLYSAWFENRDAAAGDQDREWVACIAIDASTSTAAKQWGDTLAIGRSSRLVQDVFLRSEVELASTAAGVTDWSNVPHIIDGEHAPDEAIGW